MRNDMVKRGDIFYADLPPTIGSEQGGIRPVLIVQNDTGNRYSPTTIVVTLTKQQKNDLPTHILVDVDKENGLKYDSTALCEQIKTIDKRRLKGKIGSIHNNAEVLEEISNGLKVSLAL